MTTQEIEFGLDTRAFLTVDGAVLAGRQRGARSRCRRPEIS
jgi:hypothetical protein